MILAPLQKLPKNVGDLGKLIVAKGFKKLPKVQKLPTLVTLLSISLSFSSLFSPLTRFHLARIQTRLTNQLH